GDAAVGGGVAEAGDGAGAGGLGEGDDGRVVAGLEVAVGVADFRGQRLGRAGGDARGAARVGEVVGGSDGDRERRRVARETRLGGGDGDGSDAPGRAGERGDAAGGGGAAEAGDGAGAGGLREVDDRRVVARLEVAVGVADLRGER